MFSPITQTSNIAQFRDTFLTDAAGDDDRAKMEQELVSQQRLIAGLNKKYMDGESVDKAIFAEMRSNLLLVAGDQYSKSSGMFNQRIKDARDLSEQQKIRLTKNHIRRICHLYSNNILSTGPNVGFMPKDETSLQDQKKAELHEAVWMDAWYRYDLESARYLWVDDFVQVGELHTLILWEPTGGELQGYEPNIDPLTGIPVVDDYGQNTYNPNKPVFGGRFNIEKILGADIIRPQECKDLAKAEWLAIRKMANVGALRKQFPQFKDKIKATAENSFLVFDASMGGYSYANNMALVKQFYFRPSIKYPMGQFIFYTGETVIAQGDLPGGIFPLVSCGFDEIATTPRSRGPVKQMRPYQVEINRSASKRAEHQVTLGDDKLLIQQGTKVSASASLPGIRAVSFTGSQPTILAGRSGEQFLNQELETIKELYNVMGVPEDLADKQSQVTDPFTLMYRSASQKKIFQRYIVKFEQFMIRFTKTYLALAKIHLPDDAIISAIGKNEAVNIPEFKQSDSSGFDVKIVAQSDDVESKFGKQMAINHALQYVGAQLSREDIGKLMNEMPYGNFDGMFDNFMMDDKNMDNEILALDRGEQPPVAESDNHSYALQRLNSRMKQPDFKMLPPQVQMSYQQKIQIHTQMDAFQKQQIQRSEQGFIPTTGPFVRCDVYVTDPTSKSGKSKKLEIPNDSLVWLQQHLQAQGTQLTELHDLPQNIQAQEAQYYGSPQAQQNVGPLAAPSAQNYVNGGGPMAQQR